MTLRLYFSRFSRYSLLWVLLSLSASVYSETPKWLVDACSVCSHRQDDHSGVYILEQGEEALMARSWLADHAATSIDVQYFIWSTDNIGILASEALLSAAERGVKVRVLVDDLLIDATDDVLLALATHPNVTIKIYNPQHSVGTNLPKRLWNIASGFRQVNQRMHDKTAIFDGVAGITGGRNMADEYFDFDHHYNFRDRDALLFGPVVSAMADNFEEFWSSDLSVSVSSLLAGSLAKLEAGDIEKIRRELHEYAANADNFAPEIRNTLTMLPSYFPTLMADIIWDEVRFISDQPGKNSNRLLLSGGGESTDQLLAELASARHSVLIQSPYLILPDGGIDLMERLIDRGVSIKISTNSLASTDNLMAFSGYYKQRRKLLAIGVEIFEFKPDAVVGQQLNLRTSNKVFALHAKSMLIDDETLYIGTFNLDPRSANLNTEVGVLVSNKLLANQLKQSIETDMRAENSWLVSAQQNPDDQVGLMKRLKVFSFSVLPLDALL